MKVNVSFCLATFLAVACFSCTEDSLEPQFQDDILLDAANLDPADFTTSIDNPWFTLTPGITRIYTGMDEDGVEEKVVSQVTFETKVIMGVECVVVFVREYSAGELVEETRDWYAQDLNGNVWYFGEDVKDIEDGVVYSTFGSWEAGVDGATPGIIMLANPQPGQKYRQELATGVAEDRGEVVSLNETVTVPYGTFQNCLKTKETNPLDPGFEEYKYYAPDIGFLKAEPLAGGVEELAEITPYADQAIMDTENINPELFVEGVNNSFFPLNPGEIFTYSGAGSGGTDIEIISEVLAETKVILGVTCVVVSVLEYENGELVEETSDWYAQDVYGNVWYFGEDSKSIENGVVVSTEGSWEAGVDGAEPGIIMLANPIPGMAYRQEYYEGEAEDLAEVGSLDNSITVPYGSFTNCLKTIESSALEPGSLEAKYYASGIGLIKVESLSGFGIEELSQISN